MMIISYALDIVGEILQNKFLGYYGLKDSMISKALKQLGIYFIIFLLTEFLLIKNIFNNFFILLFLNNKI